MVADSPDEVRVRMRERLMLGASQIKLTAGGGVASPHSPLDASTFTEAELRAAVEAAGNSGTYVTVHAYTPESIRRAIAAGWGLRPQYSTTRSILGIAGRSIMQGEADSLPSLGTRTRTTAVCAQPYAKTFSKAGDHLELNCRALPSGISRTGAGECEPRVNPAIASVASRPTAPTI
jgi:hypothetical protein